MVEFEAWADRLDSAFGHALAPWRNAPGPVTLLFSGGVDSSLIAWELRGSPALSLSTIGVAGSADLGAAEDSARWLGLPWSPTRVTARDVRSVTETVAAEVAGVRGVQRSVLLAVATAVAHASPGAILCGQGADELFLGYAHFRNLDTAETERRAEEDLERLLRDDWPRSLRVAHRLGRELAAPYLDPGFLAAARSIPIALRRPSPEPKAFFRSWAQRRGLPEPVARRPKRALQFGSGIDRIVRRER
jgi:asparagine synthase (glutamine-hydrolysing)